MMARTSRLGSPEASTSTCWERRPADLRLFCDLACAPPLPLSQVIPADLEAFDPEYFSNLKWPGPQSEELSAMWRCDLYRKGCWIMPGAPAYSLVIAAGRHGDSVTGTKLSKCWSSRALTHSTLRSRRFAGPPQVRKASSIPDRTSQISSSSPSPQKAMSWGQIKAPHPIFTWPTELLAVAEKACNVRCVGLPDQGGRPQASRQNFARNQREQT